MLTIQIAFLPLIRRGKDAPEQLLRIQVRNGRKEAWGSLTARIKDSVRCTEIILPYYAAAEDHWIYRGWVPVADGIEKTQVTVDLPGEKTYQSECFCGKNDWEEICFTPITHHDLGYTHTIDDLLPLYCEYYDRVLDFCDSTAVYPKDAQYRYTVEQFWSLDYYLKHTTEENIRRIKEYVRQGRIEITATYANLIDAGVNEEELCQLIHPSMAFAAECGVEVKSAAQVDMPGLSSALIRTLCDAGIPYFFAGFPQYFGWADMGMLPADGRMPNMRRSHWAEKEICPWGHPFACRWKADPNRQDSLFTWYQFGYGWFCNDREFSDTNETIEEIEEKLPEFLRELRERGYPYPFMRYIDKGTDNQQPEIRLCDIVKRWNEIYLSPRLTIATNTMFFEKMENVYDRFPEIDICGEMPHTDYTILALSEAVCSTENAASRNLLAALRRLYQTAVREGRIEQDPEWELRYRSAWRDVLLFDEHCYGMAQVTGALFRYNRGLKMQYALRGAMNSESLHCELHRQMTEGMKEAEDMISLSNPADASVPGVLHLFNSELSQYSALEDLENGRRYPVQTTVTNTHFLPYPGYDDSFSFSRLDHGLKETIVVTDLLPPCGTQTYRGIRNEEKAAVPPRETDTEYVMESPFYRIRIRRADGRIVSVRDLERNAELLDDRCETGFAKVFLREFSEDTDHIPETLSTGRRFTGTAAESVLIQSADPYLPAVTTEILLYKAIPRFDISLRMTMKPCPASSVWIAFPFAAEKPTFFFGTPNGTVDLAEEGYLVPGANTNQITFHGWCGIRDKDEQILMASPEASVISFGGLYPMAVSHAHHYITEPGYGEPYADLKKAENGHLYTLLTYNNARTNFSPTQFGEVIYRFSFTSEPKADPSVFAAQVLNAPEVYYDRTIWP